MLTLCLRSLVPGLQWKSSWAVVEKLLGCIGNTWAAMEMNGLQWKWLSELRLESSSNSSIDFVFFQLPDLPRDLTTFQKRAVFDKISKKITPIA